MRKVTVLHIITSLDMGGAERMLSNLVLGMDREKYNNVVISLKGLGYWGEILQEQGINVYPINMQPSLLSFSKIFTLYKIVRRHQPDYLQGWMYHANLVALLVGKLARVKNILWNIRCSTMDLDQYSFMTRLVYKLGAKLSGAPQAIINNSRASIAQHSAAGYRNRQLLYVPNGFDLDKFQPNPTLYSDFRKQHNLPENCKLIGMFARFDPMKDHATFLRAAGILAATRDDVYFVLAGKQLTKANLAIMHLLSEHNLQARIVLLGQIDNIHTVLPAMDYVTQTSVFGEGFPNVIGEAMACGVECFCTDVGDSLEVIGDTGYKIAPRDPIALAQQWRNALELATEENVKRRLKVRERISQRYRIDNIVTEYCKIYC